jgi:ubiquitin-protein ligase
MENTSLTHEVEVALKNYNESPLETVTVFNNNDAIWEIRVSGLSKPCTGKYYAQLIFPNTFPKQQPHLIWLTPNGRFDTNTEIEVCTHDEWENGGTVKKLLEKLITEMVSDNNSTIKGIHPMDVNIVTQLAEISLKSDFRKINRSENLSLQISEKDELLDKINNELVELVTKICETDQTNLLPTVNILQYLPNTKKDNLPVLKLSISFNNWPYLKTDKWASLSGDALKSTVTKIVVSILDGLMDLGYTLGFRFLFTSIDLSNTEGSLRAILKGTCAGRPVHREVEVEELYLTRTKTSPQGLGSLYLFRNLKTLYLDHCENLAERFSFNSLSKDDKIPKLKVLSLVGTSSTLSHRWLSDIEAACPKLSKIYFTRKKGTKALGWQDVILMQALRIPVLLPCGHIGDKASLRQLGYCSFDRQPFRASDMVEINPLITLVVKDEVTQKWHASIVDAYRNPLDAKVLYHPCGSFLNVSSVKQLYKLEDDTLNEMVLVKLRNTPCPECLQSLLNARICYPHSAEIGAEDQQFDDLKGIGSYSMVTAQKK